MFQAVSHGVPSIAIVKTSARNTYADMPLFDSLVDCSQNTVGQDVSEVSVFEEQVVRLEFRRQVPSNRQRRIAPDRVEETFGDLSRPDRTWW